MASYINESVTYEPVTYLFRTQKCCRLLKSLANHITIKGIYTDFKWIRKNNGEYHGYIILLHLSLIIKGTLRGGHGVLNLRHMDHWFNSLFRLIAEVFKFGIAGLLWGESIRHRWFSFPKDKCYVTFLWHDVIICINTAWWWKYVGWTLITIDRKWSDEPNGEENSRK